MKVIKSKKGISLISLVVTIIILLILAGVTIVQITNGGLLKKAQDARDENEKQTATEAMNLKITNIEIQSYAENKSLPSLQYCADKLCEDNDMEYVLTHSKSYATLEKIDVTDVSSIFTKLKDYPYEFEIDSSLRLASIDGVKVSKSDIDFTTSGVVGDFEIQVVPDYYSIKVSSESDLSNARGFIILINDEVMGVCEKLPYIIQKLHPNTKYDKVSVIAIDSKCEFKKSSNTIDTSTKKIQYSTNNLLAYYDAKSNTRCGYDSTTSIWEDLIGNNNITLMNFDNNSKSGWNNDCLVLDGSNDGIFLGDTFKDLFKSSATLEIVLKLNDANRNCLFGNYRTAHNIDIENNTSMRTRIYWNDGNSDIVNPNSVIPRNNIITLTYKCDKENNSLVEYHNGVIDYTYSIPSMSSYNYDWTNAWIGKDARGNELCMAGSIYKVRIYNNLLSDEEIQSNSTADKNDLGF